MKRIRIYSMGYVDNSIGAANAVEPSGMIPEDDQKSLKVCIVGSGNWGTAIATIIGNLKKESEIVPCLLSGRTSMNTVFTRAFKPRNESCKNMCRFSFSANNSFKPMK